MIKVIKVTKDRAGLHIFLDRAKVAAKDGPSAAVNYRGYKIEYTGKVYIVYEKGKQVNLGGATIEEAKKHIDEVEGKTKDADYKVKRSDPPAVGKVHETTTGEKVKITSVRNPKNPDGTWSVKGTTDAGHMPTARGTQRGIPAKTAEDLRALHGAIHSHKDDCSCASCKGKAPKDAAIKAPPAKVSKTKSSEQAREISAKLKAAGKDEKPCGCKH